MARPCITILAGCLVLLTGKSALYPPPVCLPACMHASHSLHHSVTLYCLQCLMPHTALIPHSSHSCTGDPSVFLWAPYKDDDLGIEGLEYTNYSERLKYFIFFLFMVDWISMILRYWEIYYRFTIKLSDIIVRALHACTVQGDINIELLIQESS